MCPWPLAHQTTDPSCERDLGNYEAIISMKLLKCMYDNKLIMSKYRNSDVMNEAIIHRVLLF